MRSITSKLIYEGSEGRNIKTNAICFTIGISLFFLGVICFWMKAMYDDTIAINKCFYEEQLLKIAGVCIVICGATVFAVTGVSNTFKMMKTQSLKVRIDCLSVITACICITTLYLGILVYVLEANSLSTIITVSLCLALSAATAISSALLRLKVKNYECNN